MNDWDGLGMDEIVHFAQLRAKRRVNEKLKRVLCAAVELVCAPSWVACSDESASLEKMLTECGYIQDANAAVVRQARSDCPAPKHC